MSFVKIICFLLLIPSLSYASKFKALWWNIGFHHKQVDHSLDRNLVKIASQGFDVIGLGEVIRENFSSKALQAIKKNFPYRLYRKYGKLKKNGFWVLSKHKINFGMKTIDWAPVEYSSSERVLYIESATERYRQVESFYRKQIQLEVLKNGKVYHIVFYHLSNPWPSLVANTSKYSAAWEILTGAKNPVTNQISHLRENLKESFGIDYRRDRIIMMGDSNCPRKIKGIASSCYRNLLRTLPVVLDKTRSFTYPADKVGDYKVKIDHAQASKAFKYSSLEVLKIKGSDHFPLSLFLKD